MPTHPRDPYGFRFWLEWIIRFVGSLTLSAVFWTFVLTKLFGALQSKEMILTWSAAVFGSWFIAVIPFMRKKEQIWKRLNCDQEKSLSAWLIGMNLIVGLLILSSVTWNWIYRAEVLSVRSGFYGGWLKAVFGSWLFSVMPVLIWMYRKADTIFKDAVERQLTQSPKFRSDFVEKSQRSIPSEISQKIKNVPETLPRGHVVHLILKDGRKVPHVFILDAKEILGLYDQTQMDFKASDIADALPVRDPDMAQYDESKWLRLDARV